MRHKFPRSRESGVAVVPLLVMAIGMVLIAILLGTSLTTAKGLSNSFKAEQHDYMADVQSKLASWYSRNLAVEANASFALTSEQLLAEIGTERRYGLVLVLSPQLDDGTVLFHKVAIVAPGANSSGSSPNAIGGYDATGSYFAPSGFTVLEFDGKPLQLKALAETNQKLASLAAMLEQYVTVRLSADAGTDSTFNYFRPLRDCSHVGVRELPCTNGQLPASQILQVEALKGMGDGIVSTNAWGGEISVNNDADLAAPTAPFTMSVLTNTPWNKSLIVKAVQPTF